MHQSARWRGPLNARCTATIVARPTLNTSARVSRPAPPMHCWPTRTLQHVNLSEAKERGRAMALSPQTSPDA
eukprot:5509423-Lingulodinium_polyedra.AAC.1